MLAKPRKILNEQVPQSMAGLRVRLPSQVYGTSKNPVEYGTGKNLVKINKSFCFRSTVSEQ